MTVASISPLCASSVSYTHLGPPIFTKSENLYPAGSICIFTAVPKDVAIARFEQAPITICLLYTSPVANYTNELMATRFSDVMWLIEQIMWKSLDCLLYTSLK